MQPGVVAVWWLTCLLWSSVWIFIKLGVTDVPPISLAGLRLALALMLLAPIALHQRRKFRLTLHQYAVIGATGFLLLGINYALVFWGAKFIASGTTAMLQAATPAFAILLGGWAAIQTESRRLVGAAIGIAGVAVVSADQFGIAGRSAVVGALAVTGGAACVALAYTVVKARLDDVSPMVILVGQMVAGCVPLLLAGAIIEGSPTTFAWSGRSIAALLYLATVGSIAAFWLNLWLLRKTTATAVLGMSIVEPLLAVALGAVVLGERLHALTAIGAALILVSVWPVVFRQPPRARTGAGL